MMLVSLEFPSGRVGAVMGDPDAGMLDAICRIRRRLARLRAVFVDTLRLRELPPRPVGVPLFGEIVAQIEPRTPLTAHAIPQVILCVEPHAKLRFESLPASMRRGIQAQRGGVGRLIRTQRWVQR